MKRHGCIDIFNARGIVQDEVDRPLSLQNAGVRQILAKFIFNPHVGDERPGLHEDLRRAAVFEGAGNARGSHDGISVKHGAANCLLVVGGDDAMRQCGDLGTDVGRARDDGRDAAVAVGISDQARADLAAAENDDFLIFPAASVIKYS